MSEDEKSGILEAPEEPKEANNLRILEGDSLLQDPSEKKLDTIVAFNGLHKTTSEDGCPTAPENRLEDAVPMLETTSERRQRKISHLVVYTTCFVMSLGFSIVLTGVWPYMKQLNPNASKEFLGWVVAANPLGQMIASPFLGWCGNKIGSNRIPFILTIFSFICGNILYSLLPLTKPFSDYFIILSRFIVGVSSANVAICRSYIVSASKLRERTTGLAIMAAAQSLGFILGPSVQSAIALAFTDSTSADHQSTPLWNLYTAVGWVPAVFSLLIVWMYLPFCFKEHDIAARETARSVASLSENEVKRRKRPNYVGAYIMLGIFFLTGSVFILLETIMVPMMLDMYAWTNEYAVFVCGIAITVLAVLFASMTILTVILSKKYDERKILIFLGLIPIVLGLFVMFPMSGHYPTPRKTEYSFGNESSLTFPNISSSWDNIISVLPTEGQDIAHLTDRVNSSRRGCPVDKQKWCAYTPIIEIPQLIVGFTLIFGGYPVVFSLCSSLYSKLLGPKSQGFWMGILTSVGSFSRIIGPVVVAYIYTQFGPRWMIGLFGSLCVLPIVLGIAFYERLSIPS